MIKQHKVYVVREKLPQLLLWIWFQTRIERRIVFFFCLAEIFFSLTEISLRLLALNLPNLIKFDLTVWKAILLNHMRYICYNSGELGQINVDYNN